MFKKFIEKNFENRSIKIIETFINVLGNILGMFSGFLGIYFTLFISTNNKIIFSILTIIYFFCIVIIGELIFDFLYVLEIKIEQEKENKNIIKKYFKKLKNRSYNRKNKIINKTNN